MAFITVGSENSSPIERCYEDLPAYLASAWALRDTVRRSMKKKRWSDLSERQRSAVVATGVMQVGLLVAALADLWRRPSDQVRGSKAMWTALSFVNFFGPLAYFAFGRTRPTDQPS